MNELIENLNKLLASSFAMYLKIHFFHWNVKGQDFAQYHEFFGKLYEEIFISVDKTAEQIKAQNGVAYGSLSQYQSLSVVLDQTNVPSLQEMISILYRDNETLLSVLEEVHIIAEQYKQYGLINYIEDRIDTHKKHGWMLKSSMSVENTLSFPPVKEEFSVEEEIKTYTLDVKNL